MQRKNYENLPEYLQILLIENEVEKFSNNPRGWVEENFNVTINLNNLLAADTELLINLFNTYPNQLLTANTPYQVDATTVKLSHDILRQSCKHDAQESHFYVIGDPINENTNHVFNVIGTIKFDQGNVILNDNKKYIVKIEKRLALTEKEYEISPFYIAMKRPVIYNKNAYLIMRRVPGLTAEDFSMQYIYGKIDFPIKDLLDIFRNMLLALKQIHEVGIVHGDLHDLNVIINPLLFKANIIDFGDAESVYHVDEEDDDKSFARDIEKIFRTIEDMLYLKYPDLMKYRRHYNSYLSLSFDEISVLESINPIRNEIDYLIVDRMCNLIASSQNLDIHQCVQLMDKIFFTYASKFLLKANPSASELFDQGVELATSLDPILQNWRKINLSKAYQNIFHYRDSIVSCINKIPNGEHENTFALLPVASFAKKMNEQCLNKAKNKNELLEIVQTICNNYYNSCHELQRFQNSINPKVQSIYNYLIRYMESVPTSLDNMLLVTNKINKNIKKMELLTNGHAIGMSSTLFGLFANDVSVQQDIISKPALGFQL